jgi:hypothetical protein
MTFANVVLRDSAGEAALPKHGETPLPFYYKGAPLFPDQKISQ